MLKPDQRIAIYAEATMGLLNAKMAEGILRYGKNPVAAVIDSTKAGQRVREVTAVPSDVPIVEGLDEAIALGAEALVLGTAPSGGRVPDSWMAILRAALSRGVSIVNGMHDRLNDMLADDLTGEAWIWDIRWVQGDLPPIAMARAAALDNIRVLMIGTDMAIGKMTAGLELDRALRARGANSAFLATGQTGVTITGRGIPLDAFRVDHAAGAVERLVLEASDHDVVVVEGQGSLLHPGSTATLPLMRGSCCNAMVLCHRAGMDHLDTLSGVKVPPLPEVIALNEAMARAAGALTPAKVVGIALNTKDLDEDAARAALDDVTDLTGLPATDPVRYGADLLAKAVLAV